MNRIVIMGATSGIGRKVAEIFAGAGWKVGVAGRKIESLDSLIKRFPSQIVCEKIDVTDDDAAIHLDNLIEKLGGMDTYLHCSGVFGDHPLDTDREINITETNVVGFTRLILAAYRYYSSVQRRGQIAAITSVAGTKGIGQIPAYSASKRYQQNYIEALRQLAEIEKCSITFTDIRPGWTQTPLLDSDKSYPMIMSPDKVAKKVVKAVLNRRHVAVIDSRWAILTLLWHLLPSWLWVRIPFRAFSHN